MNTKNQEPLKLASMAPLDDGGRKYNIIYVIALVIGIIAGICTHNGVEGILGANFLALLVAFAVKDSILDIKWKRLRKQKFLLQNRVPYDTLIHHLIEKLSPLGFQVEKGVDGNPILSYKKMIYDIGYDDGGTFTIYWRKSVANAFFDFRTPIYHYRITVADMGIIGYTVQQICCSNIDGNVQQNTIHGSEDLYKKQMPLNMLDKKWYVVIGIILFLFIILSGLFWLGSSSDDEIAEREITNEGDKGVVVTENASAEEGYDNEEYAIDDMNEDSSYGLNEAVEFAVGDGGKISVIFTEYGEKDDITYISYVIQNIGETPVTVEESMFSVYANDYVADLDYGEKAVYKETVSAGRKVSGRLYPRVTLDRIRRLEVECGDVVFLLRDTSAVDAMLGTYYRQYEEDGKILIDEIRLYREEYNNDGLAISARHHIDYGNGNDYDYDFSSWSFELYDDRIEFSSMLYEVEGLIIYYSKNPIAEGISVMQADSQLAEDMFTGDYEWTDNIQAVYESIENAGQTVIQESAEGVGQIKESILLNPYIDTISASSELTDSANTYKAESVFDGNRGTCWAEGVDGNGEGEYIEIQFANPVYITDIGLLNGYMKNEDAFNNNGKIDRIELSFSDGSSDEITLDKYIYPDIETWSFSDGISYSNPIYTEYLKITILEASPGIKYEDICLSELELWGYLNIDSE